MDMASSSSSKLPFIIILTFIVLINYQFLQCSSGCYSAIFGFGDSHTDVGNFLLLQPPDYHPQMSFPPYGETFFHRPNGRSCDGRLIIDFIAEYLELPMTTPYIEFAKEEISGASSTNYMKGVNYAVAGASVLDVTFYEERGIHNRVTNLSLRYQLDWFNDMLPSFCNKSSNCNEFLQRSMVVLGSVGGNDYTHSFDSRTSLDEIYSFVPLITDAIALATKELIEIGVGTIVVPGLIPTGCTSTHLTDYGSSNKEDYDPETGCLIWLNNLVEYHNKLLKMQLNQIRELHPHSTIIYADFYNAAMPLFRSPQTYGFRREVLRACCGGGGPYNYNSSALCGLAGSSSCDDPSLYVNWDGYHLTEAANKWISKGLFEGPYTIRHISTLCASSVSVTSS